MLLSLVTLVAAASPWGDDIVARPAPAPLEIAGPEAPSGAVLLKPKKSLELQVAVREASRLTLRLVNLWPRQAKGAKAKVTVRLDKSPPRPVPLSSRASSWSIPGRPRWVVGEVAELVLELTPGKHRVTVRGAQGIKLGAGVVAVLAPQSSAAPDPGAQPTSDEPSLVAADGRVPSEPAAGSAGAAADAAVADPGATNPADEPALEGPASTSATGTNFPIGSEPPLSGFTLVGGPAKHTLVGPKGAEEFYLVTLSDGLTLDAIGPGLLLFDIHAHRDARQPESLAPMVVGLFVDEVLLQTLSVDQPPSPAVKVPDASFAPSVRVTLRVPVAVGAHRVRLTLSDSAVLGASIRPRFEPLSETTEPILLSAEAARSTDLKAHAPEPEVYGTKGLALLGAAWLLPAFQQPGVMGGLDGHLAVPVAGPRLAIGISAFYGQLTDARTFADARHDGGVSHAKVTLHLLPILAELRWSAPLPRPFGIEMGLGGGALLTWFEVRALSTSHGGSFTPVAAGVAQVTALFDLGPGAILLRAAYVLARPVESEVVRSFDAGGASLALGYRVDFTD